MPPIWPGRSRVVLFDCGRCLKFNGAHEYLLINSRPREHAQKIPIPGRRL